MATRRYNVMLQPEVGGGSHASCPVLPGCHSFGGTVEAALANAKDAIEGYIESLRKAGEPIPIDDLIIEHVEVTV